MADKLAIIVPYQGDKEPIYTFVGHMREFFKRSKTDYTLILIEQDSEFPFNFGMLSNIAYDYAKDEFDYFCFHDFELYPITNDCDYSYPDVPTHLTVNVEQWNNTLPYPEYFGGAVLFNKSDFETINGYSNEYWGWGMEDLDLLQRCTEDELGVVEYFECGNQLIQPEYDISTFVITKRQYESKMSYLSVDVNDYLIVKGDHKLEPVLDSDFTLSIWCRPSGEFREGDTQGAIISRQGYDTKISYTNENKFRAELWDDNKNHYELYSLPKIENEWYNVILTFNSQSNKAQLYVNGILEDEIHIKSSLYNYVKDVPFFIGCASADDTVGFMDRDSFIGDISAITLWDLPISPEYVFGVYKSGVVDTALNWINGLPLLHIPFDRGFKNFIADVASMKYHAHYRSKKKIKLNKTTIKKCTPIYLPHRRNGTYKSVKKTEHPADLIFSYDTDIKENVSLFFDEVKSGKINTKLSGVSTLNYTINSDDPGEDNTRWVSIKIKE